jgi:hypothetical protein
MVLAVKELVKRENVERVLGIDVRDPLPGRAPLIELIHKDIPLM